MRLLRRIMRHFNPYEWNFVFNYCIETVATLATSLKCDLEWDSVDELFDKCVKEYFTAATTKYSAELLGKVVQAIVRQVRHLPATMKTLRLHLDISMGGITRQGDVDIGLDARLKSLALRYPDPLLEFMWGSLSYGPGVVTTEITSRLDICGATGLPRNVVDADEHRKRFCMSLASFLSDADDGKRMDAVENIEETMELDYFHKRDVLNSIAHLFEASKDTRVLDVARNLWDIIMTRRLLDVSPTSVRHEPHEVFRHQAVDGSLHIRLQFAYGPKHPCSQCISLGNWNDILESNRLVSQRLFSVTNIPHEGARPFAGWLRVDHDKPSNFELVRYHPVLAGTGQSQDPLYLCDITYSAGFVALQDQTERIVCPGYLDEKEQLHPLLDDPGLSKRIVSFCVLSVYSSCFDWMTEAICAVEGTDITAPFYWK
ncbi:hypothetical protein SCHPADRAFT_621124 [Schizopora paradoxa]|uniref:Uncharacterized protein n=1 Tax=Schizopora paradoxa TaxID=27342 RepID=A0A0H2R8K1_9AGAM|nr:hypothetical protein SCHPADRAFT_621124 [Schizopora paradoxa]